MPPSVRTNDLGVRFAFDRQDRPITPTMARVRRRVTFAWGLREVTLAIDPGESVALLGRNGAGKTTLLRALSGVYPPDVGTVEVRGRVGSLLAVGAGLLPQLTGRENARLRGVLAGMTRREAQAALGQVHERSQLGDSFRRPVSAYSEGMKARLGLAVIEYTRPEVLLLDEVHEALDEQFRESLVDMARDLAANGGIVIAAGHDLPELGRLCDRALLLEKGAVAADGRLDDFANAPADAAAR